MPLYEFHCTQCDNEFEELCLSSNSMNSVICPKCKDPKVERLMSTFAMSSKSSSSGGSSSSGSSCGTCKASSCRSCSK